MVAEFISRQSGSPINGETACLNAGGQAMQASHTMAHTGGGSHEALAPMAHPSSQQHHAQHQQQQQSQQSQQQSLQQQQQMDTCQAEMYGQGGASNSSTSSQGSQSSYELRKELFSQRKQREFIPDNKKDDSYWDRRRRNNEAAKRSREKRRFNDMVLEQRVMELSKENHILKAQLDAIRDKYNICVESVISPEHVLAALPSEPGLAAVKRAKLQSSAAAAAAAAALLYARTPSPVHTSVIHQTVSGARSTRSPSQLYASAQPQLLVPSQQQQQQHQQESSSQMQQPTIQPQSSNQHQQQQPCYDVEASGFQYPHFSHPHPAAAAAMHAGFEAGAAAALNLSARSRSRERSSHSPAYSHHEHELSSSAGSGDEGHVQHQQQHQQHHHHHHHHGQRGSPIASAAAAAVLALQHLAPGGPNSGLPHKLRHKSRIGDKDAASALLALQGIKQEPSAAARASPPWDNEGSSDERDSGISLGAEWGSPLPASHPIVAATGQPLSQLQHQHAVHQQHSAAHMPMPEGEREVKSRLDRLASEVASLQSILRLSKVGVGEALAAAAPTHV